MLNLLLLSLLILQDSDSGKDDVVEELTINFVTLDVRAFTKDDQPVKDLTLADFEVSEGRKKVEITSFYVQDLDEKRLVTMIPSNPKMKVSEGVSETMEAGNHFIFVLDLESASLVEVRKTFSQLELFLDTLENDKNAEMLLYSMTHGRITPFMTDVSAFKTELIAYRTRILDAMEGRMQVGGLTRNMTEVEKKFRRCQFLFKRKPRDLELCINEELDIFVELQKDLVRRTIGELEALTFKFKELDGLKTMFFVSPGFSLNPGSSALEMAALFKSSGGSGREGTQNTGFADVASIDSFEDEFRRVIHACIKNRVVFNTFDIYNGNAEFDRNSSSEFNGGASKTVLRAYRNYSMEMTAGMSQLARESGGIHFRAPTLGKPMTRMFNQPGFVYVLGYQSPDGKPGKFRKIKIKCKRKGVKLLYRTGYFGQ